MTKNNAAEITWMLDDQGHLTAQWKVPAGRASAQSLTLRTLTRAAAGPVRFSRTLALAAYCCLQAIHARRAA